MIRDSMCYVDFRKANWSAVANLEILPIRRKRVDIACRKHNRTPAFGVATRYWASHPRWLRSNQPNISVGRRVRCLNSAAATSASCFFFVSV